MAMIEGNFLERSLPAKAFATLTTPRRATQYKLDECFAEWISGLQVQSGLTLGWIKTLEVVPQPHIHAVLIAADPLDCVFAEALWREIVAPRFLDAAKVEPFASGLCGLPYVLKRLGSLSSEEPQFSDNICAFASGSGKSLFRTNSDQRRQVRRIKAAMANARSPNF